jgi:D-alanyl-D-alanine carboxypeptidase
MTVQHLGVLLLMAGIGWVVPMARDARGQTLERRLMTFIEDHDGEVAVTVEHLATREQFAHRSTLPMPAASLIKFPVMVEVYRQSDKGELDLRQFLELREEDKVPGAGILTPHFSPGTRLAVGDAVRLMIAFSDNTATNLLLDKIGLGTTTDTMRTLGFPNTRLHSKVYRRETSLDPDRSREFGLSSTTADDMVGLLRLLHERKLVSPTASDAMHAHLLTCDDRAKFPRFLPEGAKVAFKTGSTEAVRTAAGILETPKGPVAVCVLTNDNADRRWSEDNAGDLLCARIAREVWDYFTPSEKEDPEADGNCATLDRAFSARTSPVASALEGGGAEDETELGRDPTDPATESSDQLDSDDSAESRKVLPAAASTLKPLPKRQPSDSLQGPPFTACAVWAIADPRTGELLWDNGSASTPRDIASTTKIMTARVALQMVGEDRRLLDSRVTFDQQSDQTSGSSSQLVAGESLAFHDLLYAMLLPSGNDAATAVGRHLGQRLAGDGDPLTRFVAEMNREAGRLGMKQTRYLNPHGLPQKKHLSTARDLARLTAATLREPLFRQIVSTREHRARVTQADGQTREVVWRNTNRLLGIEGYQGVKTGFTSAAGSCLVSTGERGKDELIVVVLGAPSAAAAVSDSRNLYRFAWLSRGRR